VIKPLAHNKPIKRKSRKLHDRVLGLLSDLGALERERSDKMELLEQWDADAQLPAPTVVKAPR